MIPHNLYGAAKNTLAKNIGLISVGIVLSILITETEIISSPSFKM